MTRTILFAAATLLATATFAQPNAKPVGGTGPMIEVDKQFHDYGTIRKGADGRCVFTVTNTGDAPLVITNCQGSCGCTVPKCSTEPILPGAKSEITVQYDTQRVGPINKTVTINSNAKNLHTVQVMIKGTVEEEPPLSPLKPQSPMAPVERR